MLNLLRFKQFFVFIMFGFLVTFFINPISGWSALLFEGQLFEGERLITAGEKVAITLRLYDDETDGNLLFEENQEIEAGSRFSSITFEEGEVTVKKRFASVPAENLWVEVECDGCTMSPRLSLAELGSLNELTAENSSIKEAHLRTSGSATLVIDNNGVHLGATLDMAGKAIKLGGITRTTWPSGGGGDLENRVKALETLLHHFSRSGNDITISGANLYINNGTNTTYDKPNSLGNLIIGYNESRSGSEGADERTGSHNLILGRKNNYSSYGGLVAGYLNTISGRYASVAGGDHNVASGGFSSIAGGWKNTTTGEDATVTGGYNNIASAASSSISGGKGNNAFGKYSVITGGFNNSAEGENSCVAGGTSNYAAKPNNCVFGGKWNTADGDGSAVFGGSYNKADGELSCILGGFTNKTHSNGMYSCVSGGTENLASAQYSSISGGNKNSASGWCGSVSGGDQNVACGRYSSVLGGFKNRASGESSTVYGGSEETASGTNDYEP